MVSIRVGSNSGSICDVALAWERGKREGGLETSSWGLGKVGQSYRKGRSQMPNNEMLLLLEVLFRRKDSKWPVGAL